MTRTKLHNFTYLQDVYQQHKLLFPFPPILYLYIFVKLAAHLINYF